MIELQMPGGWKITPDLDLGMGHWLKWYSSYTQYEEVTDPELRARGTLWWPVEGTQQRVGANIVHTHPEKTYCSGGMRFKLTEWEIAHPQKVTPVVWEFDGNFDAPTFSPSFLCHCGFCHMFVRGGKIVSAGCRH